MRGHANMSDAIKEIPGGDYAFLRRNKAVNSDANPKKTIRLVDLFCGCGGISLGVKEACNTLNYRLEIPLAVDFEKRQVTVAGEEIHLTPIEYRILTLLIANRGKVLTHNYILKEIWGYAEGVEAGTLRVFVATLRRKIEKNPSQPQHIVTEVGVGYRFR